MADDQIRYDVLVKDALRSVIKKILTNVAKNGLPENHYFYITFLTEFPGVKISAPLKKLYQNQMTIVLQHLFWDLKITDNVFEVTLSFSNIPETLIIPFNAIQVFSDPIATFEITFDLPIDASNNNHKKTTDFGHLNANHVSKLLKNIDKNKSFDNIKTKIPDFYWELTPESEDTEKAKPKKIEKKIIKKLPSQKVSDNVISIKDFKKNKKEK